MQEEIDQLTSDDIANIGHSLDQLRPSQVKQHEKVRKILVLEVVPDGQAVFKEYTLRALYDYIREEANRIDVEAIGDNEEEMVKLHDSDDIANLKPRDLRKLDYLIHPTAQPSLLVRRHAVIIIMDPIRAVVTADRFLFVVPDGADTLIKVLEQHIQVNIESVSEFGSAEDSFEIKVYESVLATLSVIYSEICAKITLKVNKLVSALKHGSMLTADSQEYLRSLKNSIDGIHEVLRTYNEFLGELIDNDEDMALMNLSMLRKNPRLYTVPLCSEILNTHEEVSVLLESYLSDLGGMASRVKNLQEQVKSAEELVILRLDTSLNEILIADTFLSMLSCAIGLGAYITGVFGMNLDNNDRIQPIKGVFATVFAGSFGLILVFFIIVAWYFYMSGIIPKRVKLV